MDDPLTRRMIDLNTVLPSGSGWKLLTACGINDSGQIVGWGCTTDRCEPIVCPDDVTGITAPSLRWTKCNERTRIGTIPYY